MDRMDTIIDDYLSADETERLHLFLSHRDLRDAFMRIDMDQSRKMQKPPVGYPERRWISRCIKFCPGYFRV